ADDYSRHAVALRKRDNFAIDPVVPGPRQTGYITRTAEKTSSGTSASPSCRIACAEGSNWRDSSSGVRPFCTNSTNRCRNSGEYGGWLFGVVDLPFRPNDGVSRKTGSTPTVTYPSSARLAAS